MSNERIEILFEHEDFIAVSKPAGILSIPDRFNKEKHNLLNILRDSYKEIYTVHRLDRDTSGVMLYAKNPQMHKYLNTLFEKNLVDKIYHAIVEGVLLKEEGVIENYIANDPSKSGKMMLFNKGKYAKTEYQVLESYQKFSLVEAKIFTGRTHQIRVHFKSLGHPIIGDSLYGSRTELYISDIKPTASINKYAPQIPLIARTALHAQKIGFKLRESDEYVAVEASYPKDMRATLNQLSKYRQSKEV